MGNSDDTAYLETIDHMISKAQAESIVKVNEFLSYLSRDHSCVFVFYLQICFTCSSLATHAGSTKPYFYNTPNPYS